MEQAGHPLRVGKYAETAGLLTGIAADSTMRLSRNGAKPIQMSIFGGQSLPGPVTGGRVGAIQGTGRGL